jgi:hypothetical protein
MKLWKKKRTEVRKNKNEGKKEYQSEKDYRKNNRV